MGKDLWKFIYTSNPEFLLPGQMGALGDEAKEVADETASELGIAFLVLIVIGIVIGIIWLLMN